MSTEFLHHIRPSLAWEQFPDELVAIDLDRGIYFNLTGAGADLFRCFAVATTVEHVVDYLAPGFACTRSELTEAVTHLVAELMHNALLVTAEAAAPDVRSDLPVLADTVRTSASLVLHRHDDLQNLLFLDPVHEATDAGWPARQP